MYVRESKMLMIFNKVFSIVTYFCCCNSSSYYYTFNIYRLTSYNY